MKKDILNILVLLLVLSGMKVKAQSVVNSFPILQEDTAIMDSYYRSCNGKEKELLKSGDIFFLDKKYKKAMKYYEKLERKNPDVCIYKKLANVYALTKKYKDCLKYYDKVIKEDRLYKAVYVCKIAIYKLQKDKENHRKVLNEMKEVFPDDISVWYNHMTFHVENEEYNNIVMDIHDFVNRGEQRDYDINKKSLDDNEFSDVVKNIKKSDLEKAPELSEYLVNRLLKESRYDRYKIRSIAKKYPDNLIAAKLYIGQDRHCHKNKLALDMLNMLEQRGAVTEWQYWRFGISAAIARDWSMALNYYNKAIEKNDNLAWLYQNRGEVKAVMKDFEGGIEDMTKAIAIKDKVPRFYIRRAFAYRRLMRSDESLKDLIKASAMRGGYDALASICSEYMYRRQPNMVIKYADMAIRQKPRNKNGYLHKADAYRMLKDFYKAIDNYEMVLSIDKSDMRALSSLVKIYETIKEYSVALSLLKDAEGKVRDMNRLFYMKSEVYIKMRQFEKAFEELKKIKNSSSKGRDRVYSAKSMVINRMMMISSMTTDKNLKNRIKTFINNEADGSFSLKDKARLAERRGDFVKAVQLYDRALEGAEGMERKFLLRSRFFCVNNYMPVDRVIKEYDLFIGKYPNSGLMLDKARFLLRKGREKEGMTIVFDKMEEGDDVSNHMAYQLFFRYTKDIKECEAMYAKLLDMYKSGKFENMGKFMRINDASWIHGLMSDVYDRFGCYEKELNLLDTIDKIRETKYKIARPPGLLSSGDFRRANIYLKMGASKKWFDIKYKEYLESKKNFGHARLDNLLVECLRHGLLSELNMLIDKHGKGDKKYEHYCWLKILPLMKANKFKEAEKEFEKMLSRYSKDYKMLDIIYCDILDVCNGLKKYAYKKFLMGLKTDILTPMRNKGYKFK